MPKVSQDHMDGRRAEILSGARRCFADHGFEGATVRRLEEATGLSRGAIFHHFRDKDDLFIAIAEEDARRMADIVADGGFVEVMRQLVAAPDTAEWLGTRLEVSRRLRSDPGFRTAWRARAFPLSQSIDERLTRLQAEGRLRDDVSLEVIHRFLDVVLDGIILQLASASHTGHLSEVLDVVESAIRPEASPADSSSVSYSASPPPTTPRQ